MSRVGELQWNQVGRGNGAEITLAPFGIKPHLISLVLDEENNVGGGLDEAALYRNGTQELTFTFNEINSANVDSNFHIGKGGSHPTTSNFSREICMN